MSQTTLNITSAEDAARWIKEIYGHKQLIIRHAHPNPIGKHVRFFEPKTGKILHIKFDREYFNSFAYYHPNYAINGEKGESIDVKAVEDLKDDDMIFFARPEQIDMIFFGDLKEFGVVRQNESGSVKTRSVGISKLETIIST